jgi:outer membrane protein assembly factor BamB
MPMSTRRTAVVLLGLGALAALAFLAPVRAQQAQLQVGGRVGVGVVGHGLEAVDTEDAQAIQLPTDSRLRKKLDAAQDYIKEESWGEASRILQSLLDAEQDSFVPVPGKDANGKPTQTMVSVKTEANRLLGTFPAQGLEHYRLSYGATARELLNQAKAGGDTQLLAQVAQRYLYTDAGVEATSLLGAYHLDRGRFPVAALWFERLLEREGSFAKVSDSTLVQAAMAFHRLGERTGTDKAGAGKYQEMEENAWRELSARVGNTLRLGDRSINLLDLRREADQYKPYAPEANPHDCLVYRGNSSRTGQGIGDKPFMEKRWSEPTVRDDSAQGQGAEPATRAQVVEPAVKQAESRLQPVLPSFFPIAADGKLIFRTYWGVAARDLKTGKAVWEAYPTQSLQRLLDPRESGNKMQSVLQWAENYLKMTKPEMAYENSVVGTLSTDNSRVYVVDDLFFPPAPLNVPWNGPMMMPNGRLQQLYGPLSDAVYHNKLQAYSLHGGKLLWDVSATDDREEKKEGQEANKANDLSEGYFLGPPLPLHGKLYALSEKDQELRLLCLDPEKGEVNWAQALATTQAKLSQDVYRRTWAAHLAYGEGVLVCPTNAGMLLGVDLLSHALVWAHPYRERPQGGTGQVGAQPAPFPPGIVRPVMPGMPIPGQGLTSASSTSWKVTAPVIQDGRVVFTAPDGGSVRCLNLRDGSLLWRSPKAEDDLYLAGVFNGKVLIVGKKECRALSLADGSPREPLWRLTTGLPSGQGVAAGNLYYLPLKEGHGGDPEVCVIDVDTGKDVSHTVSRKKELPGNLLLYEGDVLSQTVQEVAAFPQLKVKMDQIDQLIARNPQDPVGLTERGELRLDNGNLAGAIDDLRTALKNDPPAETRAKARAQLYDALGDYLKDDFADAEKYLDEYRDLCRVEPDPNAAAEEKQKAAAEQGRRQAKYLWLVAEGRENQGRLAEAFQNYLEFGDLADRKELIESVVDKGVRAPAEVLAQGRISAMVARATPDQRETLERLIARRWDDLRASTDTRQLRKFVALFGTEFRVGREARFTLGERLIDESGTDSLPEAERQFLLLARQQDDVALAARATEALGRLMARKGLLEDAAHYYRVLGKDFADVPVRDGKTGADFLNDLATDKRFLPYLEEPGQAWSAGKVGMRTETGAFQQTQALFSFEPGGEVLPFFRRNRVALETNFHHFRLIDRQTNDVRWQTNLTRTQFQMALLQQGNGAGPRFPYHTVGHSIVLSVGHMVFGLDPVNQKVRWERSLLGAVGAGTGQLSTDPRDGTLQILYPDGWMQRLGETGPVEPGYVCLQTRDGLLALDPVTGEKLWERPGARPRSHLFGDDRYVYLVETSQDGTPTSARAIRAADGVTARDVPDFGAAFAQRQRIDGGRILAAETPNGALRLRLYDVPTGKDVWTKDCSAGSVVVHCEDPHLAAVLEPDGNFTAVDLRSAREVLRASIEGKDLDKLQGVSLVADANLYYLLMNGQREANAAPWAGPWSNFMPGTGYRSLAVNGKIYAFDRQTGKVKWETMEVPSQMLVLEEFQDLPVLLLTSRFNKVAGVGGNRWMVNSNALAVIDKRTGKLKVDAKDLPNGQQQFHTFHADLRQGKIDLTSYQLRVTLTLENGAATAEAGGKGGVVKP